MGPELAVNFALKGGLLQVRITSTDGRTATALVVGSGNCGYGCVIRYIRNIWQT